jgi:hypothetical protein
MRIIANFFDGSKQKDIERGNEKNMRDQKDLTIDQGRTKTRTAHTWKLQVVTRIGIENFLSMDFRWWCKFSTRLDHLDLFLHQAREIACHQNRESFYAIEPYGLNE